LKSETDPVKEIMLLKPDINVDLPLVDPLAGRVDFGLRILQTDRAQCAAVAAVVGFVLWL
jgi:hypothetical protein